MLDRAFLADVEIASPPAQIVLDQQLAMPLPWGAQQSSFPPCSNHQATQWYLATCPPARFRLGQQGLRQGLPLTKHLPHSRGGQLLRHHWLMGAGALPGACTACHCLRIRPTIGMAACIWIRGSPLCA